MNDVEFSKLAGDETFASYAQILACDDRATATVVVHRWNDLKLRLRGLNLPQQVKVLDEARKLDRLTKQPVRDEVLFAAWTLHEGVVEPQLSLDQAKELVQKNAVIVQRLVSFVWDYLSVFTTADVAAVIQETVELPKEALDALIPDDSERSSEP